MATHMKDINTQNSRDLVWIIGFECNHNKRHMWQPRRICMYWTWSKELLLLQFCGYKSLRNYYNNLVLKFRM